MLLKKFMEKIFTKKGWWDASGTLGVTQTKKSKKLPEDMHEIFNKICEKLCKSTTCSTEIWQSPQKRHQ